MGTVLLDGVDDFMQMTGLSASVQDVGTGAWTAAFVLDYTVAVQTWDAIFQLWLDNTFANTESNLSVETQTSSKIVTVQDQGISTNNNATFVGAYAVDTPYLVVISKAAGSATASVSRKDILAGTWEHVSTATAFGNSVDRLTASSVLVIGQNGATLIDDFRGHFGLLAMWNGVAMTQAQRMECGATNRTSNIYQNSAGTPHLLTEFTSLTPYDIVGGWSTLTTVTATLDNNDNLNWDFDGTSPRLSPTYTRFPKVRMRAGARA